MNVLAAPSIPTQLSQNAKWLAGEGAGSWFVLSMSEGLITVNRFSPIGEFECQLISDRKDEFNLNEPFDIGYPSHCAVVTIHQGDMKITLSAIK